MNNNVRITRTFLKNDLGILTDADKEYLMQNICDSEDKVLARWESAVKIKFDKKRVGYVSTMASVMAGQYVWNISIRIAKRFEIKLKNFKLWQREEVIRAQDLMNAYYQNVGFDTDESKVFLSYDTSLHYNKPMTQEEADMVNLYFNQLKNKGLKE